jgi:hypothetical protein
VGNIRKRWRSIFMAEQHPGIPSFIIYQLYCGAVCGRDGCWLFVLTRVRPDVYPHRTRAERRVDLQAHDSLGSLCVLVAFVKALRSLRFFIYESNGCAASLCTLPYRELPQHTMFWVRLTLSTISTPSAHSNSCCLRAASLEVASHRLARTFAVKYNPLVSV